MCTNGVRLDSSDGKSSSLQIQGPAFVPSPTASALQDLIMKLFLWPRIHPLPLNKVGYTDALITGMNIHVI